MRKILFISFTSEQGITGGTQCSKRNLQSLQQLFGKENVGTYIIEPYKNKRSFYTKLQRIRDILKGYMGGLDQNKINDIKDLIITQEYTDIFIDSSLLGLAVKQIKQLFPKVIVYTFFHNFEYDFYRQLILSNNYLHFYWLPLAYLNERTACYYSDKIITLNKRDSNSIEKMYNRKSDSSISITLDSKYSILPEKEKVLINSGRREALFVGSYFYGNIEGIKWFCEKILPFVDLHLTIVGSSMNLLKNEIQENEKITIYSNVPDLSIYYENADFIVLPILSGGGMKVKTAEALMYGKYIIATKEALTGYEITSNEGVQCDDDLSFISAITNIKITYKYNKSSRILFESKYSFNSSLSAFKQLFCIK